MGRVRLPIKVEGRDLWTLFDPGARNTYVLSGAVGALAVWELDQAEASALGGRTHVVTRECGLKARIQGYHVSVDARVVAEIGHDEEGKRIEVLFGALAMQKYGINVDTKNEKLDFTHYAREFVEF